MLLRTLGFALSLAFAQEKRLLGAAADLLLGTGGLPGCLRRHLRTPSKAGL